jgi:hypothetical protein
MPKGYARLTAAVLDNPVAMIAFVAADSHAATPISEIVANARLLDIDEPIAGPKDWSPNRNTLTTDYEGGSRERDSPEA